MNSEIERGAPLKMTDLGKLLGLDVQFAAEAIYSGPGKFPELIRVMYEGLRGPISFHRDFWAVR